MIDYCPRCGTQLAGREGMSKNFCPACGMRMDFDFREVKPVENFTLISAYKSMFKKYAVFSGRSRRREYWLAYLANFIITMGICTVLFALVVAGGLTYNNFGKAVMTLTPFLMFVYSLVIFVPTLALTARRLHDTGKSAWFLLLQFIPYVGGIIIFIFTVMDSQPGANKYGPSPK